MLWLNWFITDKASDTSKMSQEIRSSCVALFCKIDVLWNFPIFIEKQLWWSPFWKTVSPHVYNCTKKDAIAVVFLWKDFVILIFLVHITQNSVRTCSTKWVSLKRRLTVQHLRQSFFFDKVVHDQACNFIEKKLQHRCFTVNFTKLLKALCRTPSVSASNFNLTLLNP